MARSEQFPAVFEQLKTILQPFAAALVVQADTPSHYALDTPYVEQFKKPLFFGAAQIKKSYVSYYLMPVYIFPALLDELSPELKKRMQGKSCFNFTTISPPLLDELARLTERGFGRFRQEYGL